MAAALIVLAMVALVRQGAPAAADSDAIVFVEDSTRREPGPALAPPVLPVLEHLERDPSTLKDNEITFGKAPGKSASPRFGVNAGFGVVPTGSGGFTASFSHGLSGLGGSQAGSHSLSVGGAAQGFQVSQTSSQASSFGGSQGLLGSSLSGSQSSSQSSSFSAGLAGLSSSSSGASSSGLTGGHFGQGFSSSSAQSQSAASSFGLQGQRPSSSFPGGQSFANGQSGSGSFGNGGFSQAAGGGFSQNGFNQNSNAFSGSAANSQSFAGANQNGNGLGQNSNSFSGSQSFNGFNQNPSGFNSLSGSAANSQSFTGAGAAGRPLVGDVRRRPAPPGRDGQRFGSPIVFPGPTNNNRLRSLQYSKRLSSGLVPPDPARGQQFRPPRRRPSGSAYQVIRVEV